MGDNGRTLFDPPVYFDGKTYDPKYDRDRLKKLLGRVYECMLDGHWRSLEEIQQSCGGTEASVSARLRDLRKERFGAYDIQRARVDPMRRGLWLYRMNQGDPPPRQEK